MTFRVEVVCLSDAGEQRCSVVEFERAELALETLGMSVAEGKAILHGVQDIMAGQQVIEDLKHKCACPTCGVRYQIKEAGTHTNQDCLRGGRGTKPEVGALPLPERRATDLPSGRYLVAGRAHGSRTPVPRDQMGLADSVREGGGLDERRAAGRRDNQS